MIRRVLLDCCWSGSGKGAGEKFSKKIRREPLKTPRMVRILHIYNDGGWFLDPAKMEGSS